MSGKRRARGGGPTRNQRRATRARSRVNEQIRNEPDRAVAVVHAWQYFQGAMRHARNRDYPLDQGPARAELDALRTQLLTLADRLYRPTERR